MSSLGIVLVTMVTVAIVIFFIKLAMEAMLIETTQSSSLIVNNLPRIINFIYDQVKSTSEIATDGMKTCVSVANDSTKMATAAAVTAVVVAKDATTTVAELPKELISCTTEVQEIVSNVVKQAGDAIGTAVETSAATIAVDVAALEVATGSIPGIPTGGLKGELMAGMTKKVIKTVSDVKKYQTNTLETLTKASKQPAQCSKALPYIAEVCGAAVLARIFAEPLEDFLSKIVTLTEVTLADLVPDSGTVIKDQIILMGNVFTTIVNVLTPVVDNITEISDIFTGDPSEIIVRMFNMELERINQSWETLTSSAFYQKLYVIAADILRSMGCSLLGVTVFYHWVEEVIHWLPWPLSYIVDFIEYITHTIGYAVCHDSECYIITKEGPKKFINLTTNDLVLTHTGTFERVINMIVAKRGTKFLVNGTTPDHPRLLENGKLVAYSLNERLKYLDIGIDTEPTKLDMEFKDSILYTIELEGPVHTYMCTKDPVNVSAIIYKDLAPNFNECPTSSILFLSFLKSSKKEIDAFLSMSDEEFDTKFVFFMHGFNKQLEVMSNNIITSEDRANIKLMYTQHKKEIEEAFSPKNAESGRIRFIYYSMYTLFYVYEDKIPYVYIKKII